MTSRARELFEEAMRLDEEDRNLLIDLLIGAMDDQGEDEGAEEAWAEEIRRRVSDLRSGVAETVTLGELLDRLDAQSSGRKTT